jgi:hypothetical protein
MKRTAAVYEAPAAARAALAMRCGWVSDHSRGPNAEGSWSQCAAKKSWRLSRNRYPVAQTECLLFRRLPACWLLERLPTASRRYGAARRSRNGRSAAVSARPAAAAAKRSGRSGKCQAPISAACCGWCSAHSRAPAIPRALRRFQPILIDCQSALPDRAMPVHRPDAQSPDCRVSSRQQAPKGRAALDQSLQRAAWQSPISRSNASTLQRFNAFNDSRLFPVTLSRQSF